MLRKGIRLAAILLLLAAMLTLLPGPIFNYDALADVVTLPIDQTGGLAVYAQFYKEGLAYEDESISVTIEEGRTLDTNYLVARVKIANASQIRTAMAGKFSSDEITRGSVLAKRVNAVLAINGDYFKFESKGYVVRQGKTYRARPEKTRDFMYLDANGDMHFILSPTKDKVEEVAADIVNSFNFGPALVIEGEAQSGFPDMNNAALRQAQRVCLAQVGPLEYMCVTTEGPEDPGSTGLTLEEFAQFVASLGAVSAYNLDGGSSATMVFKNEKINAPNNPKIRSICDIIYFASAYVPGTN